MSYGSYVQHMSWHNVRLRNLVYDLACRESSIAQWLECLTGILEGLGFDSLWELRKSIFE